MSDTQKDREEFALGMAQLADLTKLCSEYVASFTTPTPSNYEFEGKSKALTIAQPNKGIFSNDAGSNRFDGVSEYDANYITDTPMTAVKLTLRKKKTDPKLDIGPYADQTSSTWVSEYDNKYVPKTVEPRRKKKQKASKSTPFSPAKAGHIGHQAAREAARRVHRRSFANVLQEAETKGKEMNKFHALKHAHKETIPHPIAAVAAKAAVDKFGAPEEKETAAATSSNRADGANVTEYDSKYKKPAYLRQLEKAVETAKLASMSLARKTGKCSEYVANFLEIDDSKIGSTQTAGVSSGVDDGGASKAMDWEQEILAVNDKSNSSSSTKNHAWVSEYDGNYKDRFNGRKYANEIIAGLPSGVDDGGASGAMEWEDEDSNNNEEDAVKNKSKLPISETGWGESENHTEFKAYDVSAMAEVSKIDSTKSNGTADAMDWTETTDKVVAPKLDRPHPEDRLSQYMESYGAAKTTANEEHRRRFSAAAMDAASIAAKAGAAGDEKDDWVIVEKEDAAPKEFQSKTWGISEYNWNFNNVWKNFATKKDVKKYPAEGLAAYGLSEYDSNFKVPSSVIKVALEKPQSKKMVKKPKNKIKRSTFLDIPRSFRTSEYKSTIAKFSKSKNGRKNNNDAKKNTPRAAGIISMAPRYPDLIRPLKGRTEYQAQFDSGRVFKIPAYVKLRMGGKRK
eukprot:g5207.t1